MTCFNYHKQDIQTFYSILPEFRSDIRCDNRHAYTNILKICLRIYFFLLMEQVLALLNALSAVDLCLNGLYELGLVSECDIELSVNYNGGS